MFTHRSPEGRVAAANVQHSRATASDCAIVGTSLGPVGQTLRTGRLNSSLSFRMPDQWSACNLGRSENVFGPRDETPSDGDS